MAWPELEPILLREGIGHATPQLVDRLNAVTETSDPAARQKALDAVIATTGDGTQNLVRILAAEPGPLPRRLALELATRLAAVRTESFDPLLTKWLRPLLRDRRIPTRQRLAAAAALMRITTSAEASQLLRDFAAGYGPGRLLDRRTAPRKRFVGRERLFDRFADRLAARLPLRCPRCRVKLRHEVMARHLWDRHRRLLVGRRVRPPWRLVEHWTITEGAEAAHRRLLRAGGVNGVSIAALPRNGADAGSSLCPNCFAQNSLRPTDFPSEEDTRPSTLSHGRLSGQGFLLQLTSTLSGPRLRIESSSGILFDGPEPGPPGSVHSARHGTVHPCSIPDSRTYRRRLGRCRRRWSPCSSPPGSLSAFAGTKRTTVRTGSSIMHGGSWRRG